MLVAITHFRSPSVDPRQSPKRPVPVHKVCEIKDPNETTTLNSEIEVVAAYSRLRRASGVDNLLLTTWGFSCGVCSKYLI